jgi:hypothetical protein
LFSDVITDTGIEEKATSPVIKKSTLFNNTKPKQTMHFNILIIALKVDVNILRDKGHKEPKHVVT